MSRLSLVLRSVIVVVGCSGVLATLLGRPAPAWADERVGFREDFASAAGWEIGTWPGITGLAAITSDGDRVSFTTLAGTFMTGPSAAWAPDWPDWDKSAPAGLAMVVKRYPVTVDLDRYHFLVARMTYSGTYMALAVNGWDTKVCYTTGMHVVDLRDIPKDSLRGRQPIELRLTFLNTGERVSMDEVRLVDSLTGDEQAALIPAGLDLRLQRLEPQPYHGLETLNARAGGPIRHDIPEERAMFRDTSTGAVVWKLTRSVRTELADSFNADGSALPIYNRSARGMVIYDLKHATMRELVDQQGAALFSRRTPSQVFMLQSREREGLAQYTIRSVDFRTGESRQIAQWTSSDGGNSEFGMSPDTDRLILGLKEGRALYVIDPDEPSPDRRVRRVPLPLRMKGASLSHQDRCVNWQRCYYFQRWQTDLDTGATRLGHYPTYGGHEIFGRSSLVGRYGTMMLSHRLGLLPCDEQRADSVRIWSNWATDLPSDYGQLSLDDRWLVTNGTEGPVAGKRLLIDGRETGTVLQIVHDFTSRNSWDSNTYSRISPDATKLVYMCDMLGDTDVYLAVTRRPEAPRHLTLAREGANMRLRWEPPEVGREVAGYHVYRSRKSGRKYRRITTAPISATQWVDTRPSEPAYYAVVAVEHAGLEGLYSEEAATSDTGPFRIYADIEEGRQTPPLRRHFDGFCSNYRCARVWKETPEESRGLATVDIRVPATGLYHAWVRVKGHGEFECGNEAVRAGGRASSDEWSWTPLTGPLQLSAGLQQLVIGSDSDGLSMDLLMLTNDEADSPQQLDDRDAAPPPVTGLHATDVLLAEVRLAWEPTAEGKSGLYSVHVGTQPDFQPGNASLLATGSGTICLDWGQAPGATLYYKVIAINNRGLESAPAMIRVDMPPRKTSLVQLPIEEATLTGGLARGSSQGVNYAVLPAAQGEADPQPTASWQFDAPVDGEYYVWARYTTVDAKRVSLFWIECDGVNPHQGANWRLRFPCTLTRHLDGVVPGEETWFSDKLAAGWWAGPFDSVKLTGGRHTLSVVFEPTHAPDGPRLAAVYLSDDPSYRPPGFDPRVDFWK